MKTHLDKVKEVLKDRAFSLSLVRIEDVDLSQEEYRSFFRSLSDYCFTVDSQEDLADLFVLAKNNELIFSSVTCSEDLLDIAL